MGIVRFVILCRKDPSDRSKCLEVREVNLLFICQGIAVKTEEKGV